MKKQSENKKSNKITEFFSSFTSKYNMEVKNLHKTYNSIILFLAIAIFILTVIGLTAGLYFIMNNDESKVRYIEEDGIKYIELKDGYIKEELTVETGTILPELRNYFREDYKLPDNLTVEYYENDTLLNVEQFTYEKDGDYYLRGIRTLKVVIHGDYDYETKLSVVDTTTPTFTLKEVTIADNESLDIKSFVDTYIDNSEISDFTVQYKENYDFSNAGEYEISLYVCDISNNCKEGTTKLTITKTNTSDPTKPGNGNTKPSGGSTKPSGGGTNPSGGSSGGNTNPNTGTTKPGPQDTVYSFDASNVITPEYRTCPAENKIEDNYDLVIDYYGTKETYHFNHVEYQINDNCKYNISNKNSYQTHTITYSYENFNGTAKTMLEEAMYIYNTKDNPQSGYQTSLDNFLNYTNAARREAGLNEVELNYHLCMIATMRAMEIAYSGIQGNLHKRPNGTSWTTLWDEYGLTIPSRRSENIAYNYVTDKKAFDALMESDSHKEAILTGMYTKMGIGKVTFNGKKVVVQTFST